MTDLEINDTGLKEEKEDEEKRKQLAAQDFGRAVTQRRKELRWSQQNLADALTTTQSVISSIENGNYLLTLDLVTRLAEALRMPPLTLVRSFWLAEEKRYYDLEISALEKVREFITEYYQIGGAVPNEPISPATTQPRPLHQASLHDDTGIEGIVQQRHRQDAKDKDKSKAKNRDKTNKNRDSENLKSDGEEKDN